MDRSAISVRQPSVVYRFLTSPLAHRPANFRASVLHLQILRCYDLSILKKLEGLTLANMAVLQKLKAVEVPFCKVTRGLRK